jgi:ferredoxin-NADP reductase
MSSNEFFQRWPAPDRGRLWLVATVVGVRSECSNAKTPLLELPEPVDFVAGQYYLVRMRIDGAPGFVEQAYSVSSSPSPPSSKIEITIREIPGGHASSLLARQVNEGDQIHLRGPFGTLKWNEADGGPLLMIGAGSGPAPFASIVRFASTRHSTVPMALLCSSRDRASILFREPLEELDRCQDQLSVIHTFTRSSRDLSAHFHRRIDAPMINEVIGKLSSWDPAPLSLLIAGPLEMVASARQARQALGIEGGRINYELHA